MGELEKVKNNPRLELVIGIDATELQLV